MYIITGMHRSGTSIVSRLFFEAGADLGNPDEFYPGDRWNPEGYFEQPDFHRINMPLINGQWGKFAYFFLPSEKTILKRAKKYKHKIERISINYRNKIVKETRFCLTLPAWLKYGAGIKKILISLREPIQVARSLKSRDHIPIKLGLKLWYEHNKRLLKYIQDISHWFVDYNKLLDKEFYFDEIKNAFKFFNLNISDEKVEDLLKKYVKPSMNHNPINEYKYIEPIDKMWKRLKYEYNKQNSLII